MRNPSLAAVLGAGLTSILLCGVAAPALAAPAQDPRLDAMQQQLDEMRAQLQQMQAATSPDPRLTAMQSRLDAMAAEIGALKQAQTASAATLNTLQKPSGAATVVSLPNGRPSLATADGQFTANIRSIIMLDVGKYLQHDQLSPLTLGRDLDEGANFRRARLGLDGRLFGDFEYSFVYEFGGSGVEDPGRLYEASVTYTALKPFRIKVGAFEPNIGLAAATSTSQMPLLERPSPAEIARSAAAGDSRVGVQVSAAGVLGGEEAAPAARWFAATAFTGSTVTSLTSTGGAAVQPFDEQTGWIGRIAIAPFREKAWQAHLGLNAQYILHPNDATGGAPGATPRYPFQLRDRPELRLDGTRLIDTGPIDARHASVYGLEGAFQHGPLLVESEAFRYAIERRAAPNLPDPHFSGWYVQGSWILSGETRPYNGAEARFDAPRPARNFAAGKDAWGAFELAARYSEVDLNYRAGAAGAPTPLGGVRGGEQKIMTLGLNWYLNPAIRVMLDYEHVDVDRYNAAGLQIGQSYSAVAARGQLTF